MPSGITWVYAMVIGGGGGGGFHSSTIYPGGGPGQITTALIRASDLGSTESVTVGSGGMGGSLNLRQDGGMSAFGSYLAAGGLHPWTNTSEPILQSVLQGAFPGQGGSSASTAPYYRDGVPGLGQATPTAAGDDGSSFQHRHRVRRGGVGSQRV